MTIPVAILCGGKGTRLKEETEFRPKPMVTVGDRPMIWHIMKTYAHFWFQDFMLCLGYKGEQIRDYFINYDWNHSDILLELGNKSITKLNNGHDEEDWRIWLVNTGQETLTGGRLKRLAPYLDKIGAEWFMATYGDGVADIDIQSLFDYHQSHGKLATVTAVRPPSRFGEMVIRDQLVGTFKEKPQTSEGWINGGYFVLHRQVLDLIDGDETIFEAEPLHRLAEKGELAVGLLNLVTDKAYHQLGWQPRWDFATTIKRTVNWYRRTFEYPSTASSNVIADIVEYSKTSI